MAPLVSPALPPATRSTLDRPDDISGQQVHVVYALPADGVDRRMDIDGSISRSVAIFNGWLSVQSAGSYLRLDTTAGALDVTFARLPSSGAALAAEGAFIRDRIERELRALGVLARSKLYAVYYDGPSAFACGGAPWPPELVGQVAALYLQGTPPNAPPCDTNVFATSAASIGYREFSMLHEIFHALGAAATCAPRHVLRGHVGDDPRDLMYAGPAAWRPSMLDVGRDDYWGHGRADCIDLARSAFVEPARRSPAPAAVWPWPWPS